MMIINSLELNVLELHPLAYLVYVFPLESRDEGPHHVYEGDTAAALLVEVLEQGDRDELQRLVTMTSTHVVYIEEELNCISYHQ